MSHLLVEKFVTSEQIHANFRPVSISILPENIRKSLVF